MPEVITQKTIELVLKEILFVGITDVSGAALAFYTYRNSANRIWPVTHLVVSVLRTCYGIRYINRITRTSPLNNFNESDDECPPMDAATGTYIYFSSLYAFSESWKCNNKLWILFLVAAECRLDLVSSSICRMKSISNLKPLLKFCELAIRPALIGLGTGYLWYFLDHDEASLQWPPLVEIFWNALGAIFEGALIRARKEQPKLLLLKGIHLLVGGCFLAASSTVLTFYFWVKEYRWMFTACMATMSFYSVIVIYASLVCLSTAATRPVFTRYCQRTLGPLLTICSSVASAYIAYHMGCRYSLMMMPLPCAGIYFTYKGFRKGQKP